MDSVVIVVSPLVSLMTDQTRSLRSRGVKAAIMSSMGGVEKDLLATADDLQKSSFLFCAPEAIVCGRWREALEKPELSDRVVAVAITVCRSGTLKAQILLRCQYLEYSFVAVYCFRDATIV